ncbi:MAG: hypothetical protein E7562_05680 [Ruminococcaceae bacterium]|nr:hypothetical protein [Oscillospiraceae bacterium]
MKKKLGIGSISFGLSFFAFIWAFEIMGFCLGDSILATLNIPTWSNTANASGTHYTVFYSLLFVIPAIPIAMKHKDDLFANVGKWLSIAMCVMLLLGLLFMSR